MAINSARPERSSIPQAWWYALLILPFVALLWVPFYNRLEPSLFGIPFFYWYQFVWVILTSLVILAVDLLTRVPAGSTPDRDPQRSERP